MRVVHDIWVYCALPVRVALVGKPGGGAELQFAAAVRRSRGRRARRWPNTLSPTSSDLPSTGKSRVTKPSDKTPPSTPIPTRENVSQHVPGQGRTGSLARAARMAVCCITAGPSHVDKPSPGRRARHRPGVLLEEPTRLPWDDVPRRTG